MSKKRVGGIAIVVGFIVLFFLSSKSLFCMNNSTYKNEIKIAFISTRNNERGIYLMNSDGGNQIRIIKDDNVSYYKFSPDGKNIAFASIRKEDIKEIFKKYKHHFSFHSIIYIMNSNGTNIRKLTDIPAGIFNWSPDGEKIVFTSSYDDIEKQEKKNHLSTSIYVIDSNGTNLKRLTKVSCHNIFPAWSPDMKYIAFSSDRDGNDEIYVMNADGSKKRRLTNNSTSDDDCPIWTPNSKKIVFMSDRGVEKKIPSQSNIYVMDIDGKNQKRLTNNPEYEIPSCVSPDGKKIVFLSGVNNFNINVIDIDGGNQKELTNSESRELDITFSLDGKNLLFRTNRDGNWKIYLMDLDGSNMKNLTNNKVNDISPAFVYFRNHK